MAERAPVPSAGIYETAPSVLNERDRRSHLAALRISRVVQVHRVVTDLADMSLVEVAGLVGARRVSPVEVVQACLTRAMATQPRLNAFSLLLPKSALVEACKAEAEIRAGHRRGPLHGIPVAVKEMFDVAGHPTTGSSQAYVNRVALEDSAAVARLRAAGAVIIGKTHTHEIAYGVTTPQCRNPWGADHTPGGSSGGSAASVAAGSSFMALGTDTGGSIRIPAACCGITGLKPTFGLCSRFGVMPLSPTLDHVGPMTRTVADAALCLQILAGFDSRDPGSADVPIPLYSDTLSRDVASLRIGIATGGIFEMVDVEVASAIAAAVEILSCEGAIVSEVEIPASKEYSDTGDAICLPEASAFHADAMQDRAASFRPDVVRLLRDGADIRAIRYLQAREKRRRMRRDWEEIFDQVDIVLAPTIPTTAFARGVEALRIQDIEQTAAAAYVRLCVPANIVGLPAISVPCGATYDGLPIGLQIIARPFAEATVLRVGGTWQRLTDWHLRRPPQITTGYVDPLSTQ